MTPACSVTDVPLGEGRAVVLEGVRIAVFNTISGWYALDAVCPHKGGPLEDGIVSGTSVLCPLHDRAFDLVSGATETGCSGVRAYDIETRNDLVFVDLQDRSPT